VAVETASGRAAPFDTTMRAASPVILSADGPGAGQGLISFTESGEIAMARNFRVPAHPAQPGGSIVILATGLGADPQSLGDVAVRLGGVRVQADAVQPVSQHSGIYAVQVRVPEFTEFGDAVPVQISVIGADGTEATSNVVTAGIEPVLN
jgi:uncharacterized protein (TIGR03437 family)